MSVVVLRKTIGIQANDFIYLKLRGTILISIIS